MIKLILSAADVEKKLSTDNIKDAEDVAIPKPK
jgi:hypothetical protein